MPLVREFDFVRADWRMKDTSDRPTAVDSTDHQPSRHQGGRCRRTIAQAPPHLWLVKMGGVSSVSTTAERQQPQLARLNFSNLAVTRPCGTPRWPAAFAAKLTSRSRRALSVAKPKAKAKASPQSFRATSTWLRSDSDKKVHSSVPLEPPNRGAPAHLLSP